MRDNDDIQREVRNMFMRTNMFVQRFAKCSRKVKILLFKMYCICLNDACLWSNYNADSLSKLKACYNKCIKKFFGFKRTDSMTQVLFELGLPSFNTVLINSRIVFTRSWFVCQNSAVSHVRHILG